MIESKRVEPAGGKDRAIPVFILEDDADLRQLLRMYCRIQENLAVYGDAASAEEALRILRSHADKPPSVGLIDLSLPGKGGIELIAELRSVCPDTVWLILSANEDADICRQVLAAGAQGCLLKGNPDDLADAVLRAVAGERVISPETDRLKTRSYRVPSHE